GQELPQGAHDEENRDAAHYIGEQQAGTGIVDRLRGAEEEPHPDRPAQGDELNVAVAQIARQVRLGLRHADPRLKRWIGASCPAQRALSKKARFFSQRPPPSSAGHILCLGTKIELAPCLSAVVRSM